mmetsp:Transcript_1707/g.5067  ORF Transcript_1707/g.5067 Transcript_1707/m.5067 type:complete len:268 (-) Transcript_1707:722-1525(-)
MLLEGLLRRRLVCGQVCLMCGQVRFVRVGGGLGLRGVRIERLCLLPDGGVRRLLVLRQASRRLGLVRRQLIRHLLDGRRQFLLVLDKRLRRILLRRCHGRLMLIEDLRQQVELGAVLRRGSLPSDLVFLERLRAGLGVARRLHLELLRSLCPRRPLLRQRVLVRRDRRGGLGLRAVQIGPEACQFHERLAFVLRLRALPHLPCVVALRAELLERLPDFGDCGVRRLRMRGEVLPEGRLDGVRLGADRIERRVGPGALRVQCLLVRGR